MTLYPSLVMASLIDSSVGFKMLNRTKDSVIREDEEEEAIEFLNPLSGRAPTICILHPGSVWMSEVAEVVVRSEDV